MVPTHGLTHIALAVLDPDRSLSFYRAAFGVVEYYRDANVIQVKGPGPHDVLAFERRPDDAGVAGGIIHFGFRLKRPEDIESAVAAVRNAGGTITSRGEFAPGLPYAYARDPDGYEIEIWYEQERTQRLVLVDKQGVTGRKTEYHSIPYKSVTHFSVETGGTFDLDAELKIWVSGRAEPFQRRFNKKLSIYEVQAVLAGYVVK